MPADLLEITDLEVRYGRQRVLSGVSLTVGRGEILGVIGETGSGKSTLARAVLGLVRPSAGRIVIDGEDVTGWSHRRWRALRRRGVVQYVFQDPLRSLDPDLTVAESLATSEAPHFLRQVRLDEGLLGRLPGQLSGGQRQRVAVARALAARPDLIFLDEPVSALDSANRVGILSIFKELRAAGTSLVFISHDLGSVAGIADRIAVLYRGALVEIGPARDVIRNPRHVYTRLLVSSAPTLRSSPADRARRDALRAALSD